MCHCFQTLLHDRSRRYICVYYLVSGYTGIDISVHSYLHVFQVKHIFVLLCLLWIQCYGIIVGSSSCLPMYVFPPQQETLLLPLTTHMFTCAIPVCMHNSIRISLCISTINSLSKLEDVCTGIHFVLPFTLQNSFIYQINAIKFILLPL